MPTPFCCISNFFNVYGQVGWLYELGPTSSCPYFLSDFPHGVFSTVFWLAALATTEFVIGFSALGLFDLYVLWEQENVNMKVLYYAWTLMCSFCNTVSRCSIEVSKITLMVPIWAVCYGVKLKFNIPERLKHHSNKICKVLNHHQLLQMLIYTESNQDYTFQTTQEWTSCL